MKKKKLFEWHCSARSQDEIINSKTMCCFRWNIKKEMEKKKKSKSGIANGVVSMISFLPEQLATLIQSEIRKKNEWNTSWIDNSVLSSIEFIAFFARNNQCDLPVFFIVRHDWSRFISTEPAQAEERVWNCYSKRRQPLLIGSTRIAPNIELDAVYCSGYFHY